MCWAVTYCTACIQLHSNMWLLFCKMSLSGTSVCNGWKFGICFPSFFSVFSLFALHQPLFYCYVEKKVTKYNCYSYVLLGVFTYNNKWNRFYFCLFLLVWCKKIKGSWYYDFLAWFLYLSPESVLWGFFMLSRLSVCSLERGRSPILKLRDHLSPGFIKSSLPSYLKPWIK